MAEANHQEATLPEINTRFLFTLALEIQVSSLGPYGRRRIFHFDGGSFDGPKLKGKVLPGGGLAAAPPRRRDRSIQAQPFGRNDPPSTWWPGEP
jgi:Protein of unknown function (DUF3237)